MVTDYNRRVSFIMCDFVNELTKRFSSDICVSHHSEEYQWYDK